MVKEWAYRSVAAVVVVGVVHTASNLIVHLLVIGLGGNEGALLAAVQIEVSTCTGCSSQTQEDRGVGLLRRRRVRGIAAGRGTESLSREGEAGGASGRSERRGSRRAEEGSRRGSRECRHVVQRV